MLNYLSLCLIALDENDYLQEWLDYHILIGVERFYIYDNGSRIPLENSLREYVTKGLVILHHIEGRKMQLAAYDHCLHTYGENNKWVGFIDADEFLVPKTGKDLAEFLKDYDAFGGLAVNSLFFGSNGRKTKTGGDQIVSFTRRTEDTYTWNSYVKCIVQPARTAYPDSPHGFTFFTPHYCVNEDGVRVDTQNIPNCINKIQLNHYICRSEEDIQEKLFRKEAGAGRLYTRVRFDGVNRLSTKDDLSIISTIIHMAPKYHLDGEQLNRIIDGNASLPVWLHRVSEDIQLQVGIDVLIIEVIPRAEFLEYFQKLNKLVEAYKQKDIEKAITSTQEFVDEYPQKIFLYTSLANLAMYYKNLELAWKVLQEAWKINPNDYEVLTQLSHFFFLAGEYGEAEKILRRMLDIFPHETDPLFRLSWALAKQDHLDEAYKIGYPVVITHGLGGEIILENLAEWIRLVGGYLKKKGSNQAARKLGRVGLKIAPGDPEFAKWSR